jgi:hypothetical protein
MRLRVALLIVPIAVAWTCFATPAQAEQITVDDPAGDGLKGRALDITGFRLANNDRAIVVAISFVRTAYGDVGLRLVDRTGAAVVVLNTHRATGDTVTVWSEEGEQRCPNVRVRWNDDTDGVRLRLPSGCYQDGDYGAVRAKVIAEIGSDADFAPKSANGRWVYSAYVARG